MDVELDHEPCSVTVLADLAEALALEEAAKAFFKADMALAPAVLGLVHLASGRLLSR